MPENRELYDLNPTNRTISALDASEFADPSLTDPSLAQGHEERFSEDIHIQMCSEDSGTAPKAWQAVHIRGLCLGAESDLVNVSVEISSEDDLFFSYTFELDAEEYPQFQAAQKLRVPFAEFPSVVARMLSDCRERPNAVLAVLVLSEDGATGRLDFIENHDYKLVELLSVPFHRTQPARVREMLTFRYEAAKSRTARIAARLDEITQLLRIKNPSLLMKLAKGAGSAAVAAAQSPAGAAAGASAPGENAAANRNNNTSVASSAGRSPARRLF